MKNLEKAVEALRTAMVDGDRTTLTAISSENLTYGHSSGKIETQKEFVENIVNGNSNFDSIELSNQQIIIQNKTGIVRHDFYATTHDAGRSPGEVKLHIMTVWVKEGKDWKIIGRQAVRKM
ncbi:MAG: nuclear transport factor 2 family protein [Saprospiraceae bacterium]|nr:nuclear transport factor 2 family protein [Saprospiraceae bacterium]